MRRGVRWVWASMVVAGCGSTPIPVRDVPGRDGDGPDGAVGADVPPADVRADVAEDVRPDAPAPDAAPTCIDLDGDGYGAGAGCRGPDCDDTDATVHPGAPERCDMVDSNCDGDADLRQSDELDAWCVATASIDCGRGWPTLCRHAGDELERTGFSPFASPRCMLACTIRGGTNMFIRCWRDPPSEYGTCPRPVP